jgi:hypothetical protein
MKTLGMGMSGNFHWWEGVVENNLDPLGIGRCKVRVLGHNTPSKLETTNVELPWAYPLMPLNNAHGKIVALKIGTRVFGYFRDGQAGQDLVMMGTVNLGFDNPGKDSNFDESKAPYVPINLAGDVGRKGNIGFVDDRVGSGGPIQGQPQKTKVTGSATSFSHENISDYGPLKTNEPNSSRLTRGIIDGTITEAHIEGVASVTKPSGGSMSEPANPFAAKYPFNTVEESDAGHIKEIDDTPGAERIKESHRTGTFYEIHPDGTKVTKVVSDEFSVTIGDKGVKVEGVCAVHVVGKADFYCEDAVNIKSGKNTNVDVGGDAKIDVAGNLDVGAAGFAVVKASDDVTVSTSRNASVQAAGDCSVVGAGTVDVISGGSMSISAGGLITFRDSSATASNVDAIIKDTVDGRGGSIRRVS